MIPRDEWLDIARKLDWEYSYVTEPEMFPETVSGRPWLSHSEWCSWDEPYRTTYRDYVITQHEKDASVYAVRDAVGRLENFQKLDSSWLNALKFHSAALPLAEFAAVVGNLRAGRFARDSAWRTTATFGALDECRHTQIPLLLMHELVRWDPQFDWTHKFYHTNNWVAIASRHLIDELLLASNPIEFAVATNFVFETGFTNLQFVGLSALSHVVGDHMFEKMVSSIQTDEARHAQIGPPVLATIVQHDPEYAQYLLDKWFWRSWLLFSILTGFCMDYLTPLEKRSNSFKEFMEEWILDQYLKNLEAAGMRKPWYWETFLDSMEIYHHMVYAAAYTYRATVWFNMVAPGPAERQWLKEKYPKYWDMVDPIWEQVAASWKATNPGIEWSVHGLTPVGFCDLCQLVLCGGNPARNTAQTFDYDGRRYIFCSEPCAWLFKSESDRYSAHKDVVKRILAGEAPSNILELVRKYFCLTPETWGKDVTGGRYPWLTRETGNSMNAKGS
jgi:toluene monooxygenase system protein A